MFEMYQKIYSLKINFYKKKKKKNCIMFVLYTVKTHT